MKTCASLILSIFFIYSSLIKTDQSKTFECEYLLEASGEIKTTETLVELPTNLTVKYKVITNGIFYLVIGQLQHVSIAFTEIPSSFEEHIDSMLFEKGKDVVFILNNRTYSKIETALIDSTILKDSVINTNSQYQKIVDSRFYIDSIYKNYITPFPQFSGNRHGIIKIISKNNTCTLKSVKEVIFDFESLKRQVKNYTYSQDTIPLPL